VLVIGTLAVAPTYARTPPSFTLETIDIPGAVSTSVDGINANGDIVGSYWTADNVAHGFARINGEIETLDFPDLNTIATQAVGINARGDVVGIYTTSDPCVGCPDWIAGVLHGFLWRDGEFQTVMVPGSKYTTALSINAERDITGEYWSDKAYGWVWRNGSFTTIDMSESTAPLSWSAVYGVNARGDLVGWYGSGETWVFHGYVKTKEGDVSIDGPGSTWTLATGLNARGTVVGWSLDGAGNPHGFVWNTGTPVPFDVPGSMWTYMNDINDRGDMVGQYATPDGIAHGFVMTR
jgi:probable HAF family extracellular repeat protein